MPPWCSRCFPNSTQFEYSRGCDRLDEHNRSGGSLKLNVAETVKGAQSRLRNAPLRRAVEPADMTPNATSVKAGHDGDLQRQQRAMTERTRMFKLMDMGRLASEYAPR